MSQKWECKMALSDIVNGGQITSSACMYARQYKPMKLGTWTTIILSVLVLLTPFYDCARKPVYCQCSFFGMCHVPVTSSCLSHSSSHVRLAFKQESFLYWNLGVRFTCLLFNIHFRCWLNMADDFQPRTKKTKKSLFNWPKKMHRKSNFCHFQYR